MGNQLIDESRLGRRSAETITQPKGTDMSEEQEDFTPTWRYGPDGQSEVCHSQDQVDELEELGWQDTPVTDDDDDDAGNGDGAVTMDNTRAEIAAAVEAAGLEVDQKATKADLLELLAGTE